uniref:Uncharacterized protein n=1 Tax=Glossina morsitans morsitans TaxID=37546 RepID=A0A1B0FJ11_GLOMM
MEALNYSLSLILVLSLCHVCIAWPTRYIRAIDDDLTAIQLDDEDLNPVNAEGNVMGIIVNLITACTGHFWGSKLLTIF